MSILFCDTDCEITFDEAEKLNIRFILMPYTLNDKEYYFDLGKTTDYKGFFNEVRKGALPTTAALNTNDYLEYFEPVLKQGEDILYVAFSSAMSNTFEYMNKAIEELKIKYPERKITVYDTRSISIGSGMQIYYAALMKQNGASDEEIIEFLKSFTPKVRTIFVVEDLKHLKRGGRISSAAATFGTLFNIKPILHIPMESGKVESLAKAKGRKMAVRMLAEYATQNTDTNYRIMVTHADCENDADNLIEAIKEKLPQAEITKQFVGPVIGAHCGADVLGVSYITL